MVLYKVSAKDPNQRLFRIFAWGAIILLTGILAISLYDPTELSDSARRTIGGAAVVLVLISIAGAVVFSARRGMWKLKRTFQFQLSDDGIFQMREGSPTVGMPLRQIESLREYRGWLVIRGGGQADPIAIPSEVENFEQLKQRLTSYCALTTLKTKISPLSYLPFALAIVVYVLLFTSHVVVVVAGAGCIALLLQGWGFYSLRRAYRGRKISLLVVGTYLLTCLAIIRFVYERTRAIH